MFAVSQQDNPFSTLVFPNQSDHQYRRAARDESRRGQVYQGNKFGDAVFNGLGDSSIHAVFHYLQSADIFYRMRGLRDYGHPGVCLQ